MPQWASFDAFLEDTNRAKTDRERQMMVDELLAEHREWPWIEQTRAVFAFNEADIQSVALNLDTIGTDPPFAPMTHIQGTSLWYVTHEFHADDLLDYLLAVDDPMTPLASDPDVVSRIARHWRPDPLNPIRMSAAQTEVSILRMPGARPFPDWSKLGNVPRGSVHEHTLSSQALGFEGRKLWVYVPYGYEGSGMAYPLLIIQDGQWAVGPLQLPEIADTLIKHDRVQPLVIAMIQSASQAERDREYAANDAYFEFLLRELLPMLHTRYRLDSANIGVGGVAVGAGAALHAALRNPAVFSNLIAISPPMGKSGFSEQIRQASLQLAEADVLPRRIFQSVGRYEAAGRFVKPALALREALRARAGVHYRFVETGSGHGLAGFRSILPEALAWAFPGAAFS
jgi:enterochelin esterase family protein